MIWKIAKKEFLLNLMTFKFAVGTIVCVVLTAVLYRFWQRTTNRDSELIMLTLLVTKLNYGYYK